MSKNEIRMGCTKKITMKNKVFDSSKEKRKSRLIELFKIFKPKDSEIEETNKLYGVDIKKSDLK